MLNTTTCSLKPPHTFASTSISSSAESAQFWVRLLGFADSLRIPVGDTSRKPGRPCPSLGSFALFRPWGTALRVMHDEPNAGLARPLAADVGKVRAACASLTLPTEVVGSPDHLDGARIGLGAGPNTGGITHGEED
jgi:hypothetical protein